MRRYLRQKGFTLIELLVVMAIIGILATIAVAAYTGIREKARVGALQQNYDEARRELLALLNAAASAEPILYMTSPTTKKCDAHINNQQVDTDGNGVADIDICQARYNIANNAVYAMANISTTICNIYVAQSIALNERSPFRPLNNLFAATGTAIGIASAGQLTCIPDDALSTIRLGATTENSQGGVGEIWVRSIFAY